MERGVGLLVVEQFHHRSCRGHSGKWILQHWCAPILESYRPSQYMPGKEYDLRQCSSRHYQPFPLAWKYYQMMPQMERTGES